MSRFAGKTALVTGAGRGIGLAIAERLASEGAKVVLADVNTEEVADAAKQLCSKGLKVRYCTTDVASEAAAKSAVDVALDFGDGKLDVLVNNAARFIFGEITEISEQDIDACLGTNVKGYMLMAKHAVLAMKANQGSASAGGGGVIVNIASISSFIGQPAMVPYSTSKGAIMQLTRNLAVDCGKYGIRVNAVCPGPILTNATEKHAASQGKCIQDLVDEMQAHMIQPRMGKPEEVAAAVAFLASDEASFITGTSLMVDGGYIVA